jgi:hypothetical protein
MGSCVSQGWYLETESWHRALPANLHVGQTHPKAIRPKEIDLAKVEVFAVHGVWRTPEVSHLIHMIRVTRSGMKTKPVLWVTNRESVLLKMKAFDDRNVANDGYGMKENPVGMVKLNLSPWMCVIIHIEINVSST